MLLQRNAKNKGKERRIKERKRRERKKKKIKIALKAFRRRCRRTYEWMVVALVKWNICLKTTTGAVSDEDDERTKRRSLSNIYLNEMWLKLITARVVLCARVVRLKFLKIPPAAGWSRTGTFDTVNSLRLHCLQSNEETFNRTRKNKTDIARLTLNDQSNRWWPEEPMNFPSNMWECVSTRMWAKHIPRTACVLNISKFFFFCFFSFPLLFIPKQLAHSSFTCMKIHAIFIPSTFDDFSKGYFFLIKFKSFRWILCRFPRDSSRRNLIS